MRRLLEINFVCISHSNLHYLIKVFQIQQNFKFGQSRISAGFVKKAGFWLKPEPNSGTALELSNTCYPQNQCEMQKAEAEVLLSVPATMTNAKV